MLRGIICINFGLMRSWFYYVRDQNLAPGMLNYWFYCNKLPHTYKIMWQYFRQKVFFKFEKLNLGIFKNSVYLVFYSFVRFLFSFKCRETHVLSILERTGTETWWKFVNWNLENHGYEINIYQNHEMGIL